MKPILAAVLLVLVAGCGNSSPAAPTKTVTVTAPGPSPSASEPFAGYTGDPSPTAAPDSLNLRVKQTASLGDLKATVFEYRRDIKDPSGFTPDSGMRWDEALIKVCNSGVTDDDDLALLSGYGNWLIYDNDGGTYNELDLSPSPATSPQWNYDRKIRVGQCQKGWLGFEVPRNLKPTGISFGRDGNEEAFWKFR